MRCMTLLAFHDFSIRSTCTTLQGSAPNPYYFPEECRPGPESHYESRRLFRCDKRARRALHEPERHRHHNPEEHLQPVACSPRFRPYAKAPDAILTKTRFHLSPKSS